MSADPPPKKDLPGRLRERAEQLLSASAGTADPAELRGLLHELQVHQVELELQNEELRETQAELAESRDQYSDLYDFAPFGYLTIDRAGTIHAANLTLAHLLGVERGRLLRARFASFVAPESQDTLHLYWQRVFAGEERQSCEISIRGAPALLAVRLEGVAYGAGTDRRCRIAVIDIGAVQAAQRQLETSERRYRRLATSLTEYIYRARIEQGRLVEILHGPHCTEITGFAPQEFDADPQLWHELVHEEDRPLVQRNLQQVLAGEDSAPLEHRIRRRDGEVRWVRHSMSPDRDGGPTLTAFDGLLQDVTATKRAEQEAGRLREQLEERVNERSLQLARREHDFRMLAANVPEMFAYIDHNAQVRYVNRRYEAVLGRPTDQIVGARLEQLLGAQYAAIRIHIDQALAGFETTYETSLEVDGGRIAVHVHYVPDFDEHQRVVGFFSLTTDITARKRAEDALQESESRLQGILETAGDAIITLDRNSVITSANPTTSSMFGYADAELLGQRASLLMPSLDPSESENEIEWHVRSTPSELGNLRIQLTGRRRDGSVFPIEMSLGWRESLAEVTCIARDITERRELQRQVIESAAAEDRRIGHELHEGIQQQLTALQLFAGTLRDALRASQEDARSDTDPEKLASTCQALIERLCRGLSQAHADVRRLARGIIPVQIDAHGLGSALSELATATNELGAVECRCAASTDATVSDNTTATHLYRIAQEAINNALRHSRCSQILISLQRHEHHVRLEVTDNGIGMQRAISERPPEPSTPRTLGLGAMSYRAGLVGGTLRVDPAENGGTRVTCLIPAGDGA